MRLRFQPWQLAALLALMCCAVIAAVYAIRGRPVTKPENLVAYLPTGDAVVVYIDVDSIRRSGVLDIIAGSKATEELEYQQFTDQTLFDYRQDLDAVAVAFRDDKVFFVLRGRFHWRNLRDYALAQGGSCHNTYCTAPASKPGRYISFYPIKQDLMALGVSPDEGAAYDIRKNSGKLNMVSPEQPAWMVVPAVTLRKPDALPPAIRPFASALRNTQEVMFAIGPAGAGLQLALMVTCKDQIAASALLVDLESATNSLRKLAANRSGGPPPADLELILTHGVFRRQDRSVYGEWPVPRSFLDTVFSGSL